MKETTNELKSRSELLRANNLPDSARSINLLIRMGILPVSTVSGKGLYSQAQVEQLRAALANETPTAAPSAGSVVQA